MNNKKKRSKKVAIILACLLIPLGAFGIGYFFGGDTVNSRELGNTLTVNGTIGGTLLNDGAGGLVPGDTIDKTIEINPNCTTPSLLRVKIQPYWDNDENDSSYIKTNFSNTYSESLKETEDSYWYKSNDGYIYYIGTVNNQEKIPLVNGFTFESDDDTTDINRYQNRSMKINVELDVIQAKNKVYNEKWGIQDGSELKSKLDALCDSVTMPKQQ